MCAQVEDTERARSCEPRDPFLDSSVWLCTQPLTIWGI